jgi:hypothetical protein
VAQDEPFARDVSFTRDVLPWRALAAFEEHIGTIRRVAREHGYAIGVHGSLARDIDLIAAPWIEECAPAEVLVRAIAAAVDGVIDNLPGNETAGDAKRFPVAKPHGRLAWSIQLGGGPYIDLSVMPRR